MFPGSVHTEAACAASLFSGSHMRHPSVLVVLLLRCPVFMSVDINPVLFVNVTWRLASESAQSLFGNPCLAYYGAIDSLGPLLLWHVRRVLVLIR